MNKSPITCLEGAHGEMQALLRRIVSINSGTRNKPGVDRVMNVIKAELSDLGLKLATAPQKELGDILIASTPAAETEKGVLIIGHMDTVFPADSSFQTYREDDRNAYGPGVIDMKGGLVAGVFALKALHRAGVLTDIPIRFVFNSDEEIGSPASGRIIAEQAEKSVMAFVLECGGHQGEVVVGRKGRAGYELDLTGRAGHAANNKGQKVSSILELGRQVVKLESLNGRMDGLTVNVGQVSGGVGPNSIPEKAWASIDARFNDSDGYEFFRKRLEEFESQPAVEGVSIKYHRVAGRPPMPVDSRNIELYNVVRDVGEFLGLTIDHEFRAGGSDANLAAAAGLPVLDGLGPLGDYDHSDREYMIKDSLLERCGLFSMLLIESWKKYKEGALFHEVER